MVLFAVAQSVQVGVMALVVGFCIWRAGASSVNTDYPPLSAVLAVGLGFLMSLAGLLILLEIIKLPH